MINEKRLIKTLLDLLKINSPSGGEKSIADFLVQKLISLGLEVQVDNTSYVTGSNTGNIIASLKGKTEADPILFTAHMDTINPTDNLVIREDDEVIKSNGETILGADNKSGLAIILEAVESLIEHNVEHISVEIVFTVSEETGLLGANALDLSLLKSKLGFCFDGGGNAGLIVLKAPTQEVIKVNFIGKAVHAGIEPEKGHNAIIAASTAIINFPQGRIDEETTANVGLVSGGVATNVVAENASFEAEIRSHNQIKLLSTVKQIEEIVNEAAEGSKCTVEIEKKVAFYGFEIKEEDSAVALTSTVMEEMGIIPIYAVSGGGSDANVFNKKGLKTITLSMGAQGAHSNEEFVKKDQFVKTAELAFKIIKKYSEK